MLPSFPRTRESILLSSAGRKIKMDSRVRGNDGSFEVLGKFDTQFSGRIEQMQLRRIVLQRRALASRGQLTRRRAHDKIVRAHAQVQEHFVADRFQHLELRVETEDSAVPQRELPPMMETRQDPAFAAAEAPAALPPLPAGITAADLAALSRNAPCPCGSGKKFKHCHGAVA